MADPLIAPRAWFVLAKDATGDGVAERLLDITLANAGDAIVTPPMQVEELRSRLSQRAVRATLYPLLGEVD